MWFRRPPDNPKLSNQRASVALTRTRLPVDLLAPGMRIVKLDRPWTEVPVLFQGFTIDNADQLSLLRHYCDWVLVEAETRTLAPLMSKIEARRRRREQPMPESRSLESELPGASRAYAAGQRFVSRMLADIEAGNMLDLTDSRPVIAACVTSISANPNAMFWMNRIKHQDAYTAEHCLRVAIFAVAFARFLDFPKQDMEVIGLCGLLHDIGKMHVPKTILNKPGALNSEEMAEMKRHTEYGFSLLQSHHTLDPIVAAVCRDHHERLDGRGYPRGLEAWQISRFARLISIVDAYDAITSDRCYRAGLSASDAMRILFRERNKQFDPELIEAFIRMIGIYPPGSLVEMTNGEIAVVIGTHPSYKLRPRIEILLNGDKQPIAQRLVDLKDEPTDDNGHIYTIAAPLPDGAYDISLSRRVRDMIRNQSIS
ncbi:HD-GYP domain-containing protein [Marinobacter sp. BGYM27]|uniref:HD-GYP domain-containing protein n=1 Tax=Marinobacter sp. BGYM27 TaxID=2975597 RepID=UPI0021A2E209|nr:HD-GYP domain-containing protein [Marinobacter sp. BGYM27]MDG5501169.1 HD-GYP domain-containing protein [Marinobacter sp. BGYM27]